jgi:hypothetical protein
MRTGPAPYPAYSGPENDAVEGINRSARAFGIGVLVGVLLVLGSIGSIPLGLYRLWQRHRGTVPDVVYDPPLSKDANSDS